MEKWRRLTITVRKFTNTVSGAQQANQPFTIDSAEIIVRSNETIIYSKPTLEWVSVTISKWGHLKGRLSINEQAVVDGKNCTIFKVSAEYCLSVKAPFNGQVMITKEIRIRYVLKYLTKERPERILFNGGMKPPDKNTLSSYGLPLCFVEQSSYKEAEESSSVVKAIVHNMSEWCSIDFHVGKFLIEGWLLTSSSIYFPPLVPSNESEELYYEVAVEKIVVYESSAILNFAITNNRDEKIMAVAVQVGSERIDVPLSNLILYDDRRMFSVGLLNEINTGEAYDVAVTAFYEDGSSYTITCQVEAALSSEKH